MFNTETRKGFEIHFKFVLETALQLFSYPYQLRLGVGVVLNYLSTFLFVQFQPDGNQD